jgi:hypothetical protein
MWFGWTSASLGASYYSGRDVRSAGDHGIDEFTNAISVAEAILLFKFLLVFVVWVSFRIHESV